jgi:hypothetical protein
MSTLIHLIYEPSPNTNEFLWDHSGGYGIWEGYGNVTNDGDGRNASITVTGNGVGDGDLNKVSLNVAGNGYCEEF